MIGLLIQTAIGIGVGIGLYVLGALNEETFSWEGLANSALDAFLLTSGALFVASSVNYIKHLCRSKKVVIDGVQVERAKKSDFTRESWERIKSLEHKADGSTISSLKDGRAIHNGFKVESSGFGKELCKKGIGRFDYFDETAKIIYELKPNNAWSVKRGITQLHRYNVGMGGGYKLVLILY